jgi:hypothetical protein
MDDDIDVDDGGVSVSRDLLDGEVVLMWISVLSCFLTLLRAFLCCLLFSSISSRCSRALVDGG